MNDAIPDVDAIDPEARDCGPFALAGAIVRQAIDDLEDRRAYIRADARAFLFDPGECNLGWFLERVPTGITADAIRRRLGVQVQP
jgi:hypothetical protein